MTLLRWGVLTAIVSLTFASSVCAQAIYNWNAPGLGNGNFGNPFIWSPNGPPGVGQEARFNSAASAYTVTFTSSPTNFRTFIGNDQVTFNLGGHTYTLTSTDTSSLPSLTVGGVTFADDALLTLT